MCIRIENKKGLQVSLPVIIITRPCHSPGARPFSPFWLARLAARSRSWIWIDEPRRASLCVYVWLEGSTRGRAHRRLWRTSAAFFLPRLAALSCHVPLIDWKEWRGMACTHHHSSPIYQQASAAQLSSRCDEGCVRSATEGRLWGPTFFLGGRCSLAMRRRLLRHTGHTPNRRARVKGEA